MEKKFYAYFVPNERSGITDKWEECEKFVKGKSNAKYKSFKTRSEAEEWLTHGAEYDFKNLEPGIYFDAGTGRGKGVEVSVTDERGEDLLGLVLPKNKINRFGKYRIREESTNNYGELLGLKFALVIADKKGFKKIFGDSRVVINFWSRGFVKEQEVTDKTLSLIDEVVVLRSEFGKKGGAVICIGGRDNPADLGFHR